MGSGSKPIIILLLKIILIIIIEQVPANHLKSLAIAAIDWCGPIW